MADEIEETPEFKAAVRTLRLELEEEFDRKVQQGVDKRARALKDQARDAGREALLEELGVNDIDILKKKLAAVPAADAAQALQDAEAKAQKAEANATKAAKTANDLRKILALVESGVQVGAARRLARLIEIEDTADDDELTDGVKQLKKDMPDLFKAPKSSAEDVEEEGTEEEEPEGDERPVVRTNPGGPGKQKLRPKDPMAAARALLHERHPQTSKTA